MVENYDDTLSRFHTIPACHGQTDGQTDRRTDGQTELLYQYRANIYQYYINISMLTRDKNVLAKKLVTCRDLSGCY